MKKIFCSFLLFDDFTNIFLHNNFAQNADKVRKNPFWKSFLFTNKKRFPSAIR